MADYFSKSFNFNGALVLLGWVELTAGAKERGCRNGCVEELLGGYQRLPSGSRKKVRPLSSEPRAGARGHLRRGRVRRASMWRRTASKRNKKGKAKSNSGCMEGSDIEGAKGFFPNG